MRNSPRITWKYIHRIESACRGSTYNRAHEILAELEACIPRVWIFTQNVDGFHRAAGSKNVVDIHGDIHDLVCTRCTARERVEDFEHLPPLPRCSSCGAIVRPDVVLFDEYLSEDKVDVLYRELDRGFDIIFTVGTSSMFAYITDPIWVARRCGTPSVEIDPGLTEVSDLVDIKIPLPATYTLEMIWQIYSRRQSGE
jgi:NAD-dependent deacetylase